MVMSPKMLTLYETGNWRIVVREKLLADRNDEYLLHLPCMKKIIADNYMSAKFPHAIPHLGTYGHHPFCAYCPYEPNEVEKEHLFRFVELYYR